MPLHMPSQTHFLITLSLEMASSLNLNFYVLHNSVIEKKTSKFLHDRPGHSEHNYLQLIHSQYLSTVVLLCKIQQLFCCQKWVNNLPS